MNHEARERMDASPHWVRHRCRCVRRGARARGQALVGLVQRRVRDVVSEVRAAGSTGEQEPWFLNSGRAVLFTPAVLAAASALTAALASSPRHVGGLAIC